MCFWEDDLGEVHEILQGEGGEQGDPLMPALFALGQHKALDAIQNNLRHNEKPIAFHDDLRGRTTNTHGHIAQPR